MREEWSLRFQMWRMNWFPHRLYSLTVDERGNITVEKRRWVSPRRLRRP